MRGLAILVTLVVLLIGAPMVFAKSLVLCSVSRTPFDWC